MKPYDNLGLWSRTSVGKKITLISIFFVFGLIAIILLSIRTAEEQKEKARVIELVGRQRMLQTQQINLVQQIQRQLAPRTALDYFRKVWIETQEALINGGPVVARLEKPDLIEISGTRDPALRKQLQEQMEVIRDSVKKSDEFLAAPDAAEQQRSLQELTTLHARMQELATDTAKAFTADLLHDINRLVWIEAAIGVLVVAFGLWLGALISRQVAVPLQQIVASAESIADGDLRVGKLNLARGDEVGQLARAFDHMLDNLKELSGQIVSVTGNVNSAAAEILTSTQEQAASTKEQAATVQEISTTMQEITQSGSEISERAKKVAASAEATSTASNSGISAVQSTNRLMESIREQVEEVARKIVSVSEKTQAIGEIISTVNEIAEQSNLLALNASIEAASAGEQGSRFAVVASEMRSLAERAKESTVQVGSILSDIQKGINSSVMLTEEAVKRSESGKQQAEVAETTIHQMMRTTVDSINAFQQIIGATNQQQIGFDQVAQGMRDIRQAAEQNALGTSQLEQALANLHELSRQLREAVGRYKV
jgi:methyl-accepting chemotaxis protein